MSDIEVALAINGGQKTRTDPWPERGLLGIEEKQAVERLFESSISSGKAIGYNGETEESYCREFSEYMGGGYTDAVNSGTSAVYVGLRAFQPEPYTEIIVGPISDPGGIMPIPLLNCIPVVADAAPGSFNTGPDQIAECMSDLTSALCIPHIFGEPADMEGIMNLASERGIPVLEDCAQAHGARLNGRLVGTFGNAAAFSTMFGKHHSTGGQGGLIFTKDESMYWKFRRISDRGKPFGLPDGSTNCLASHNFNLNDLSAAIGREQLNKLPKIVDSRRRIVESIREGIRDFDSVGVPLFVSGAEPSFWFLRLELRTENLSVEKETYCDALEAEGILFARHYNFLPHTQDWFRNRRVFGSSGHPWTASEYRGNPDREFPCPNARKCVERHIHLDIRESWGPGEVNDIVSALGKLEEAFCTGRGKR